MYTVYERPSGVCDSCGEESHVVYGCGANKYDGATIDTIAVCIDCLKNNFSRVYLKHVELGHIDDKDASAINVALKNLKLLCNNAGFKAEIHVTNRIPIHHMVSKQKYM